MPKSQRSRETTLTADMEGLRKPFPPELIGKLPGSAKRPALDYVGHAAVTDRLLQCAPGWEFKVLDLTPDEHASWVLGRLTIDGVSRDEYGEGDDPKKAISDALKRCAMRFGVALDLWSKEDLMSSSPSIRTSAARGTSSGDPKAANVGGGGHIVDPLAGNTPSSTPSGDLGKGPDSSEAEEVGADMGVAPASEAVHVHDWKPAPREGWVLCSGCGLAEMKSKVKT
jgi:hypothetical protein